MWWILIAIVAIVLMYLFSLPGSYEVVRTRRVRVNVDKAYGVVSDFAQWKHWSPWLIHDTQTEQTLERATEPGGFYRWKSAKIGEGRMTHRVMSPTQSLAIDLQFIKPFRSLSDVEFQFTPAADAADQCDIRWTMRAKLPLPMRPFCPMFKRMIGLDFELGLGMLAGYLDASDSHPRLEFLGATQLPSMPVIREAFEGGLQGEMQAAMHEIYPKLTAQAALNATGVGWAIYHKIKPMKNWVKCDFAVGVQCATPGASMVSGGKYFHVRLRGAYDYLPSAWNSATGHVKMNKLKWDASRPALECYPNNPMNVPNSNEWITELYLPIK